MRRTKAQMQRDRIVKQAYGIAFNCVPVNMLDLPKIFRSIETAYDASNGDKMAFVAAMKELVRDYRAD